MSKIKCSLFAKVTAIFLSVLILIGTALSVICVIFCGAAGGYTGEYTYFRNSAMESVLREYAYEVVDVYENGVDLDERYAGNNFYYSISVDGAENEPVATNYNGEKYIRSITVQYTGVRRPTLPSDPETDTPAETTWDVQYEVYDGAEAESIQFVTVQTTQATFGEETETPYYRTNYSVTLYEKAEKDGSDILSIADTVFDLAYELRYASILLALLGLSLFIFVLVFLFSAAGHHRGEEKASLNYVDRIPFDLYTAICAAIAIGVNALVLVLLENLYYSRYYNDISNEFIRMVGCFAGIAGLAIIDYLILLGYTLSFATRVKVGGLIRRTLIYRILAFFGRILAAIGKAIWSLLRSIPLVPKTVLILLGISLIEFILLLANLWEGDNLLLLWLIEKVLLCPLILWIAVMLRKLKKGGEAIAAGRLQEKIDTRRMPADFGKFGQTLNHIGDGLGHAVDERMKSERMKTELITNVSHDIKTPLTSIINYVDLIEKEEPESETMHEYISVLKRQAARLKKLIEDLVEASKASSGTLSVEMARCEVGVLLEQTLGEYEDKLTEKGLTPVVSAPEEPIFILADGRRLWRVFDNLLNNICKYAQPDTRVYISLERIGHRAVITFRNISKDPLNISSDELMERFVRGDSSRNTEGSGLGLSIARSLTELQNGRLALSIDGDLFKAIVSFETVE
ncbi:MAG: sensor histidine kinase [Clostridia bacterium]|nr:sensor histidine kinase [Clostridia bacterium]